MKLEALFAGTLQHFGPQGKPSGIFKTSQSRVRVALDGIEGDHQGDRKVHGGPEKALHQYAGENYRQLTDAYPSLAGRAVAGSMGENMSCDEMNEGNVFIGDIYQVGSVRLQVSAPRIPCWKISHKFDLPGLDGYVGEHRITGWYYRVLEAGEMSVGDPIELLARMPGSVSIDFFMSVINRQRQDIEAVCRARDSQGLDPQWQKRMQQRIAMLTPERA